MKVNELIEKLKAFPDDMEVLNSQYCDIKFIYEDVYPYMCERAPESLVKTKFVIVV